MIHSSCFFALGKLPATTTVDHKFDNLTFTDQNFALTTAMNMNFTSQNLFSNALPR